MRAIVGINSRIPETITVSPAMMDVVPAAKATPNAVMPAEISTRPAPIPSIPMPSKANAPAKARIGPISGLNRRPAIPITANAPAKATKPFAISPQLILPSFFIEELNIAMATDMRIIWPANLVILEVSLSIILAAATRSTTAPRMPAPPLARPSQLIDANILATPARIPTATDMRIIWPANLVILEVSLSIILAAATRSTTAPRMPAPPLARPSQLIDANILATPARIPTATDMRII